MHQIAFDLKRAHLRTKWWGEKAMGAVEGMTAARFDLLFLIREKEMFGDGSDAPKRATTESMRSKRRLEIGVSQRELRERVDVTTQTMSMMLKRLERLRWVRRGPAAGARYREKIVYLTALGLQCIAKAMRIMFRQRKLLSYFERICKAASPYRYHHVVSSLFELSDHVQFIARSFGDRSVLSYDYGSRLFEGPWQCANHGQRRPFDALYVEPPPPPPKPIPLVGADRERKRPFGYTAYENNMRAYLWGTEKELRRKRKQRGFVEAQPRRSSTPRRRARRSEALSPRSGR